MTGAISTERNGKVGSRTVKRKDGSLTREHFSLREFRLVAKLRHEGATADEVAALAVEDNIFQYPTTSTAKSIAQAMNLRVDSLNDDGLVGLAARGSHDTAAQINLYAMMRVYPLVCTFMMEEVAPRYRSLDYTLSRTDVNAFITRYQTTNPSAAKWTDQTTARISNMLRDMLSEAGYLATSKSEELLPFTIDSGLEETMYRNGDQSLLPAFNAMEEV